MTTSNLLEGFPSQAPAAPKQYLQYADVAVTSIAPEFNGTYRGKQYHTPDFSHVLSRAKQAGVQKVLLTGMYLSDIVVNFALARTHHAQCKFTAGIHPYHAVEADDGGEEYFSGIQSQINNVLAYDSELLGAFGEIGLDYDKLAHAPKDVQIRVFKRQLEMIVAEQWDLPLFLHCRNAFEDFTSILTSYLPKLKCRKGLVHSFVGTVDEMQHLLSLNLQISVNNFSFRTRESLDMVRAIPLDKLQLETDAPWAHIQSTSEIAQRYLPNSTKHPWTSRKKDKFKEGDMIKERNEPCSMEKVAMIVAGIKGLGVESVAEAAWENSIEMFFEE